MARLGRWLMEEFPAFEEVLAKLCGGEPVLSRLDLYALSGASRSESKSFARRWPDVPLEDRRQVMSTLAEYAEANFEMDFARALSLRASRCG